MKVAIDLTPLYGRKWTGVELYAIDLYRAFLNLGFDVIPIFHVKNEIDTNTNTFIIQHTNRVRLENYSLPKAIRKIKASIVVFPIFPPPFDLYINRPSKIVTVLHDTAFIRYRNTLKLVAKYYLTSKSLLAMRYANCIVTVSGTEVKQFRQYTKLPILNWGENISKEFLPENININKDFLGSFGLQPYNYYISVSTIEPRKNLKYLLNVIKKELIFSDKKLVLVGRKGWGNDHELKQLIIELKEHILFTGYLSVETLQTLYHYAFAFTLLSLDEGFGRTPLEAVACGCKTIIVSDIDIFHETLQNSGNYIPLDDVMAASSRFTEGKWRKVASNFIIPFNVMEDKINLSQMSNIIG